MGEIKNIKLIFISLSILFFFLLLFEYVDAFEMSVSPPSIDFSLGIAQRECMTIDISLSKPGFVYVGDYWSEEDIKDLDFYVFNAREMNLLPNYTERMFISSNRSVNFCILGAENGIYRGVLTVEPENRNLKVGIWLNVKISTEKDNNISEQNFKSITGSIVSGDNKLDFGIIMLFGMIIVNLLLLILLFLLFRLKKRRIEEV
ncbi:hypothetical protein J4217_02970 [Candidatus Pacearchaeota archaeon]|nr:hypothetical protein [Candidatus Pacearchaeota archaeon]